MIPESRETCEQIIGLDDTLYELYHAVKYSKELSITNSTILQTDKAVYEFQGSRLFRNGEDYAQGYPANSIRMEIVLQLPCLLEIEALSLLRFIGSSWLSNSEEIITGYVKSCLRE